MKKEELFEVLGDIDEKNVKEAGEYVPKRRPSSWTKWGAVAACAVIIAAAAIIIPRVYNAGNKGVASEAAVAVAEETTEEAARESAAAENAAAPAEAAFDTAEAESAYDAEVPQAEEAVGEAKVMFTEERTGAAGAPEANDAAYADGVLLAAAVYPPATAEGLSTQEYLEGDARGKWWTEYREKVEASSVYVNDLQKYSQNVMEELLTSSEENTVCSPLNTFMAFAMLSEVTDGNTRAQILDMLEVSDIEDLRERALALWEANYANTPNLQSLLANSVWLRSTLGYNNETLQRLADTYYASSFAGEMGSDEMNEALRNWTNENTGGLLEEYTKEMGLDAETVMAIVSTIYYKAAWIDEFNSHMNTQETFHGTAGDTEVTMMHKSDMMGVYRNDAFTSVSLNLMDSGAMHFYLPNEGVDVNDLVSDPDVFAATEYSDSKNWSTPIVNLSLPKFKVSASTDLLGMLENLGVTDVLDPGISDFTPLTEEADELFLSTAVHAAMVEIDENGVTGAAYTELAIAEGAAEVDEEIDLVFDKPFMFVVTGKDGSVLFSGIVRNI